MKTINGVAGLLALGCAMGAFAEGEKQTYKISDTVDGIDLLAQAETYMTDRLEGPAPKKEVRVKGEITHAEATRENPFRFIGDPTCTATTSGKIIFEKTVTSFDGSMPLAFSGYTCFIFEKQEFNFGLNWTDDLFTTDGQATLALSRVAVAGMDNVAARVTFEPGTPLYQLVCGPNPVTWQFGELRCGLYNGGDGIFEFVDVPKFKIDSYCYLGVDANRSGETAGVKGELKLTRSNLHVGADLHAGTGCHDDGTQTAMTNVVVLGEASQLKVRKLKQEKDPSLLIRFSGGELAFTKDTVALFQSWNRGTVTLAAEDGADFRFNLVDADQVRDFYLSGTNKKPLLIGGNRFVKDGPGTLVANMKLEYAGATEIKAGTLRLGGDDYLQPTALTVEAGASLDLCGHVQTVASVSGAGTITDSVGGGKLIVLDEGDYLLPHVTGQVALEKRGSGKVQSYGFPGAALTVAGGSVELLATTGAFPHWRFKVDGIRGNVDMMQFSELKLYSGAENVTAQATVSWDETHTTAFYQNNNRGLPYPAAEAPGKAVDGNVDTKWLDWRAGTREAADVRDAVWLRFDFAEAISVSKYEWYTANDTPERDPVSWRLQASKDGKFWVDVDVQENATVTTERKTLAYAYTDEAAGSNGNGPVRLTLAPGTALTARGQDLTLKAAQLSGATLTLDEQSSLTLVADEGESDLVDLSGVTFAAAEPVLRKTGEGFVEVLGLDGFAGRFTVEAGEARFASRPIDPLAKYFRWTVKKVDGRGDKFMQVSEFSLYDANGTRLNTGMTNAAAGTDPSALKAGEYASCAAYQTGNNEGVDKAFDNDNSTKWCLPGVTMNNPADANTWRAVVLRLPESAGSVASYSFTTANDSTPTRNPTSWTLEASVDGAVWVVVDERKDVGAVPASTFTESERFAATKVVESTAFGEAHDAFAPGSCVSVFADATLTLADGVTTLDGLEVDPATGAGTIAGFAAAETGALALVNVDDPTTACEIPLFAVESYAGESRPSLAKWTVTVNGTRRSGIVRVRDGKLELGASGFVILVK